MACLVNNVSAQTLEERETARDLMDRGDERAQQGDLTGALELYRSANEIMHVPTTLVEVARTLSSLGKLVEARQAAADVLAMPRAADEPKPFTVARTAAEELMRELTAQIPTLRIQLEPANVITSALVRIQGEPVSAARTQPYPLDPGEHRVAVSAPGFESIEQDVTLVRAERRVLQIVLEKHAPEAVTALPTAPRAPTPALPKVPPRSEGMGVHWLTWTGVGLCGAGLITGAVAGVIAVDHVKSARKYCVGDECTVEARPDREAALTAGMVSNIGWVTAGAGGALALVSWLALRQKSTHPSTATSVSLVFVPSGGVVQWRGQL